MKKYFYFLIFLPSILFFSCAEDTFHAPDASQIGLINQITLNVRSISAIDFDSKGGTWIATNMNWPNTINGNLYYYHSGKILREFTPEKMGIMNPIKTLCVDKNDNLWIGAETLYQFDGSDFRKYDSTDSKLLKNSIRSIISDKENSIWISTTGWDNGGIIQIDGQRIRDYTVSNSPLSGIFTWDMVSDKYNNKWIISGKAFRFSMNVIKISGSNWQIIDLQNQGAPVPQTTGISMAGNNPCVGVNYQDSYQMITYPEIFIWSGNKWLGLDLTMDNKPLPVMLLAMTASMDGSIWAFTQSFPSWNCSLLYFDGKKWNTVPNVPINTPTLLKTDRDNNLWIPTGNRIYIYGSK